MELFGWRLRLNTSFKASDTHEIGNIRFGIREFFFQNGAEGSHFLGRSTTRQTAEIPKPSPHTRQAFLGGNGVGTWVTHGTGRDSRNGSL